MPEELLNVINHDGTRRFGKLPKAASWLTLSLLFERIRALPRVRHPYAVQFASGQSDAVVVGFTYAGYDFSVRERDGEYWFLVSQPDCPDLMLQHILAHCRKVPAAALRETVDALEAYGRARGPATPPLIRTSE